MIKLRKGFKIAIGSVIGLGILGGITYNQAVISKRLDVVQKEQAIQPKVVIITATPEPTATPSAIPTILYRYPIRPVVTKAVVK